jgi:ribosomal protein S21
MRRKQERPIQGRIEVTAEECNYDADKMVRRFTKKVKNEGIMEECRSRAYFKKPSEVRREDAANRQRVIDKVNRQRITLVSLGSGSRYPSGTKKKTRG